MFVYIKPGFHRFFQKRIVGGCFKIHKEFQGLGIVSIVLCSCASNPFGKIFSVSWKLVYGCDGIGLDIGSVLLFMPFKDIRRLIGFKKFDTEVLLKFGNIDEIFMFMMFDRQVNVKPEFVPSRLRRSKHLT